MKKKNSKVLLPTLQYHLFQRDATFDSYPQKPSNA